MNSPEKPARIPIVTEHIPDVLKRAPCVLWRWEWRTDKWTKPPFQSNGHYAKSTAAETWTSFDQAMAAMESGRFDGVGIVLNGTDDLTGVDLDDCVDADTGEIHPWAWDIIKHLNSYSEITPSKRGCRVFLRGTPPRNGCKKGHVEIYNQGRYLTVTGQHIPGTPHSIEFRQEEITAVHAQVFGANETPKAATRPAPSSESCHLSDEELLDRARAATNGAKFDRLYKGQWEGDYSSQSEADAALCFHLAFWCDKDAARIDVLFRQSALFRPKWETPHYAGGVTYGAHTVQQAIETVQDTYRGGERRPDREQPLRENLLHGLCRMLERGDSEDQITEQLSGCGLGEEEAATIVREATQAQGERQALEAKSAPQTEPQRCPYQATEQGLVWLKPTKDGPTRVPLTNFTARIVADISEDDGADIRRNFELEAVLNGRRVRFAVPAGQFAGMSWAMEHLGAQALVYPGFGVKDHARAAVQLLSPGVKTRRIFAHTGWRKLDTGEWGFLHANGAVGPNGPVMGIEVALPQALSRYALPDPPSAPDLVKAIKASLACLSVAPDRITFPQFCAIWRAVLGQADFSVHLSGPTGVGKTELAALAQQHFGPEMDARHLPASWSSTGNSLEVLAFQAKDVLLVVDDFAPTGSVADIQRYHRDADRLLRAQGNNAGRQRLRPDATLKPSRYPRGLAMSTGEDIVRGQSLRARVLLSELAPQDMHWERLKSCQRDAAMGLYAQAMAGFLCWLAKRYEAVRASLKDDVAELRQQAVQQAQHRRTPDIVANLTIGLRYFLDYAYETGAITIKEQEDFSQRGWGALGEAAKAQASHQAASEPTRRFLELLNAVLSSGRAHLASFNGEEPYVTVRGEEKQDPKAFGWRLVTVGSGDYQREEWRPQGDRVGWVDDQFLYLEPDASYAAAQRLGNTVGDTLTVAPRTLRKRLKERGLLVTESKRDDHLTVRRMIEGRRREVLYLHLSLLMSIKPDIPDQPDHGSKDSENWSGKPDQWSGQKKQPDQENTKGINELRGNGPVGPVAETDREAQLEMPVGVPVSGPVPSGKPDQRPDQNRTIVEMDLDAD